MPESIVSFMSAVHRTVTEVTRRAPGYFATRPLRARTPPPGSAEAVSAAFGIRLLTAGADEFTAVDDLLDRRRPGTTGESRTADGGPHDWPGWRRRQDRQAAVRAARATHLARVMDRRTAGGRVRYRAGGRGSVLVLLTAVGHTDEIWYPLAEQLLPGRRLLMWDCGEHDLAGLLADLDAVLAAEAAEGCDLLSWCSGAQVALEYAASRPGAVRSAVLLHGSYPRAAGDPATAYERNLAAVCATVAARPDRAARCLQLLTGDVAVAPLPADEHAAARAALARTPPGWEAALRRPFRDAAALAVYSRQLTELWRRRLPAPGAGLPPLLSLTAELDRVAAPDPPASLWPLLTGAGRLAGATHYSMLDRPALVARTALDFFADPVRGLPVAGRAEICRQHAGTDTDGGAR